jgi:hypothetical protein
VLSATVVNQGRPTSTACAGVLYFGHLRVGGAGRKDTHMNSIPALNHIFDALAQECAGLIEFKNIYLKYSPGRLYLNYSPNVC